MDRRQDIAHSFVVARGDRTKPFDFAEEILDQVTLAVDMPIQRAGFDPVGLGWDHRGLTGGGQRLEHVLTGVECFLGGQHGRLHRRQRVVSTDQIVRLTTGQHKVEWGVERIDQSTDLGAQPSS
jgi:hypothetical protein